MFKAQKESPVEKAFVNAVEKELKGYAFKGDVPGRRFLDRIVILPKGVMLWCELKRPQGGRYSRQQLEWCERLTRMGHYVVLISEVAAANWLVAQLKEGLLEPKFSRWLSIFSVDLEEDREALGLYVPGLYVLSPDTSTSFIWSLPHE